MKNAVIVKSFQNGIALYLDPDLEFEKLLDAVAKKFKESERFFKDASVAVSFEGRVLSFEEEACLVKAIMDHSMLKVACIVGKDEENDRIYGRALDDFYRKKEEEETSGQFYRGTLRSGQILETESSIIVLGDVEEGASVIASGDIVVLGSLRGNAYAGGSGQTSRYIAALEMTPQKLKIGDFKYIAEEKRKLSLFGTFRNKTANTGTGGNSRIQPKMAYVENERIILRPITNESLNSLTR